jgi:hypothetical protein
MAEKTLDELKDIADGLGLKYHPTISAAKLADKIEEFASEPEEAPVASAKKKTPKEIRQAATKLVRVRVTCMNPAKRDWDGEIFMVGNRHTGTLRKYVPYGVDWHVPQMILDMIKARQCQVFQSVKRRTAGGDISSREGKLVKEFAVEILPPLTEKELAELAQRQAMAAGTSGA